MKGAQVLKGMGTALLVMVAAACLIAGTAGCVEKRPDPRFTVEEFWKGVMNTNDPSGEAYIAPVKCDSDHQGTSLSILLKGDQRSRMLFAALLGKMELSTRDTGYGGQSRTGNETVVADVNMPDMDQLAEKVKAIVDDYRARYAELLKTMTAQQIEDDAFNRVLDEINRAPTTTVKIEVECQWDKDAKSWKMTSNPLDELGLDKVIKELQAL